MQTFTVILIGLISHLTLGNDNVSVLLTGSHAPHESKMTIPDSAFVPGGTRPAGCNVGSACVVNLALKRVKFDPFPGQTGKLPSFDFVLHTNRVSKKCRTLDPRISSRTVGGPFNSFIEYSGGWLKVENVVPQMANMAGTDDTPPKERCVGCEVWFQEHRTEPVSFQLIDGSTSETYTLQPGATIMVSNEPQGSSIDHWALHFEVFTDCDKAKKPKKGKRCESTELCRPIAAGPFAAASPAPATYDVECTGSQWP